MMSPAPRRELIAVLVAALTLLAGSQAIGSGAVLHAAWYRPDPIDYAGSIFLYLHNPGDDALAVSGLSLDGEDVGKVWLAGESFISPEVREQYLQVTNDQVMWYRVYPNPIPAHGVSEVILRLAPRETWPQASDVVVTFEGGDEIRASVPIEEPAFDLDYVGLGPALDEIHVYARSRAATDASLTRMLVDGAPVGAEMHTIFAGYTYAHCRLTEPWKQGSYHAVAIGDDAEVRAVLLRALPTPPPLAIMGNLGDDAAQQYVNHLFDAHIAFVPAQAPVYDTLEKYGLRGAYLYYKRLRPDAEKKTEPCYYADPAMVEHVRGRPGLWAYFLEDEPDGRYHRTDLTGLQIARDVERANQFCRVFDAATPTYLQIDHGGYPRNLQIYSQIPDYVCTHAYALGTQRVIEATAEHARYTRLASRPRPFYYLNCGYAQRKDTREFSPEEMRLEVYTALSEGAKSLQWYPAHGDNGLLKHPRMWDAVGAMNGVLHQLLPLLAIGTPVDEPRVEGGDVRARSILCGESAMAVMLVNQGFTADKDAFSLRPAEVRVRARVPSFLRPVGVVRVDFPEGPQQVAADIGSSTVSFTTPLTDGAAFVIYSEPETVAQMRRVCDQKAALYRPLAQ